MPTPTSNTAEIPAKMKKMVVVEGGDAVKDCKFEIQEVDVPQPGPNEFLVKVVAAAVNPSDYGGWTKAEPQAAMGNEGAGIVVALGSGLVTTMRVKIGQKVGIVSLKNQQGTYSEYVTLSAVESYFPLPDDLPVEDAASFFVNPYTVLGIMDTAKNNGSPALIHTAAASQLGQMMVKIANDEALTNGVEIINVVRRDEQVKLLQDLGAKHIINTSEDNWKEALKQKVDELKCTVAFDAISGATSGDLLSILPPKGTLFVYGGLAGGGCSGINPIDLIYRQKEVKGFFLSSWIQNGGMIMTVPRMMAAGRKVNAGLAKGGWASTQFKDVTQETMQDELVKLLEGSATGSKLRVRFD